MSTQISQINNQYLREAANNANTNIADDFIDDNEKGDFEAAAYEIWQQHNCTSDDYKAIFGYAPTEKAKNVPTNKIPDYQNSEKTGNAEKNKVKNADNTKGRTQIRTIDLVDRTSEITMAAGVLGFLGSKFGEMSLECGMENKFFKFLSKTRGCAVSLFAIGALATVGSLMYRVFNGELIQTK